MRGAPSCPPPIILRAFALVLIALVLAGCAGPDGGNLPTGAHSPAAPTSVPEPSTLGALLAPGCQTPSGTSYLFKCWTSQLVIAVATTSTNETMKGAIQSGIGKWNGLLGEAPTSYRRSFGWNDTVTATADVGIEVHGSDPDVNYCGKEGNGRIHLYLLGTIDCPAASSWYGKVATVVAHELSTVLGWRDDIETRGVAGISDPDCVSTWPSTTPGPLSTLACYHDVDGVLKLYRNGSVNLGAEWEDYFGTKILASSDAALSGSTVQVGDSVDITAQYLTAGPHAQYSALVPYGPGAYQAIPSSSGKAHQSGNTVVADDTGSVTIMLRPVGPPSGYALWEPLHSEGVARSLTIALPPPPPPFQVNQITPDTGAITVPGWQTFTAHVVSAPGTPFTTRWIIVDSRTPTVADTVWNYSTPTTSVQIAAGASYTLTLRARPYWSETIGFEFTQDIPVCTGGGVALMLGSDITPPTTDAVGGCSSGGGGNN